MLYQYYEAPKDADNRFFLAKTILETAVDDIFLPKPFLRQLVFATIYCIYIIYMYECI